MDMDALKPILAGLVRHGLTTLGGMLVASGYMQSSDVAGLVGTGMILAGVFWSWWQKEGQAKVLAALAKMHKMAPPAATTGQAAKAATDAAKAVASILLVAFVLSFLVAGSPAQAQGSRLTGNIVRDIQAATAKQAATSVDSIATVLAKPFQDIADFIGADADGAVALSTAIPGLQDGHGQQCWIAMQSFGAIVKAHPIPITFHVINDYESLRLLGIATNNLCSNVHCTQVFSDFTAMAQAASPMPLAIPSLHDLCTKVPQIAVVAPVTAPAVAPTPAQPQ